MNKKIFSLILACILSFLLLTGCGSSGNNANSSTADTASSPTTETTAPAETEEVQSSAIDTSKAVSLTMYLLGDAPSDIDVVYQELNKKLTEKINATLKTNYLSWGDWNTKYSLILASGEDVDLIYTSDWAYYGTESAKGAFYELTDEFINTYMPKTAQSQEKAAIMQATINGKLFAMPKNSAGLEGESWIVIRKDLREKYGLGEIKNIQDLENYFAAVAQNENGILPYAAASDGGFQQIAWTQPNQLYYIPNTDFCFEYPGNDEAPDSSVLTYSWLRDDAVPYYELMKKWNSMGFWSKNAISNTEQVRDAFENGKSASLTWNSTIFTAGKNLQKNNPEWTYEALDINPGTPRRQALFTNDAIAVTASSKNPERAAMFIDLVKNDLDIYLTLIGGIEGKHYVINEDGSKSVGPDADKYPWNPSTWCFNLATGTAPFDADALPEQLEFEAQQMTLVKNPAATAFRFDPEPVKSELAAVDALRDEMKPMFQLGMVEDINAQLADWKSKAEVSGLGKIEEEIRRQYDAWRSTLN